MEIKGKVTIVTGSSSGIGEATARQLGQQGAKVVLAARRLDRLEKLASEIAELGNGAEALAIRADMSNLEDIKALVEQTLRTYNRIDVLVNNAGFGRLDWLENLDPVQDIQTLFAVNVLGVIQTTRQVLPAMINQRCGHIINMCSIAGLIGMPTYTIYAASKHAVHGFSEALRREVRPWGIHVSLIYPGGVFTEFNQRAKIKRKTKATTPKFLRMTPEKVAQVVTNLVRNPRAMAILPWLWWGSIWLNRNFNALADQIAIKSFTIPERKEEMKRSP